MASEFLIDVALTTDYDTYTVWNPVKQNTTKNEIIDKYDAMLETASGHRHDGVNSRLYFENNKSMTTLTSTIIMRVLD